jgi:hypothetical protein
VGHSVVETGMVCAAAPPKEGLRMMNKTFFRFLARAQRGRGSLPNGGRRANENPFHC